MLPLIGSLLEVGMHILDKALPDPAQKAAAQLELLKLQQAGEFKELDAQMAELRAQTDINLEQAKSSNLFVSGARPSAMWVCVGGMCYTYLLAPLGTAIYTTYTGHPLPVPLPTLDDNLWQLLVGMLGLAGWRSFDKKNGVAR